MAALLLVVPPVLHAQANDAQLQSSAQKTLHAKRFRDIHVSAQNGTVTLSGSVKYFSDKVDAEKRVKKTDHNAVIENTIQVDTPEVSDAKLEEKLVGDINNSRVGYGTTAFNAISVSVHGNGVVVLGGYAYGPVDASTAFNIAANTKGVREVINHIHVDPPSPQDDRIRRMEYRAIYGAQQLNRYALNPVKPIRIQVENGHVTLFGTVDSKSDKEVAGIQANSVPGVFSVTNDLQVAGQEH
ncbi:MAG: BON domain-containing protein [Acidobacteriaceae bacterium]